MPDPENLIRVMPTEGSDAPRRPAMFTLRLLFIGAAAFLIQERLAPRRLSTVSLSQRKGKTMYGFRAGARCAFTLIELLVVIAIISVLAAILFPVFAQAREQARQIVCTSNVREIGLAVNMYLQDYDETFPIFYAYNTQAPDGARAWSGDPLHKGAELEITPYSMNKQLFSCPDDDGGPTLSDPVYGCPGRTTYQSCYGSSYRFSKANFSVVAGESSQNNAVYSYTQLSTLAGFEVPAQTRMIRDEMFPWFGTNASYGYIPGYFQQWHTRGGGTVFADGHSKFTISSGEFDQEVVCPFGGESGQVDPNAATDGNSYGTYYGICD